MVSGGEKDELRRLREENARLRELLTQHGIAWEEPAIPEPVLTESAPIPTHFTTDDKIALFRRLFRGREDVYPQRWESAKGTSGYSPACGNGAAGFSGRKRQPPRLITIFPLKISISR